MISSKKGVVEVQFNWVFIIIIGAVILGFFVSLSMRQKDVSEQKLSATVAEHMKTILTGAQVTERSVNLITVPRRDITYDCGEGFSISSMASFNPRIIFAPSLLKSQSQKLITWSLDWNMPFRITNFLYMTSPDIYYIFVHDFSDIGEVCLAPNGEECVNYQAINPNNILVSQTRKRIDTANPNSGTGPCWCGGKRITGINDENKGYCCAGGEFTKLNEWRCYNLANPSESLYNDDCCRKVGGQVGFCSCIGVEITAGGTLKEDERTPPCQHDHVVDRECLCGGNRHTGAPDNYVGFCCKDGAFINTVNLAMRLNNELPDHPSLHTDFVTDVSELGTALTRAEQFSPYKFKLIFFNYNKAGRNVADEILPPGLASMEDEDVTAIHVTTSENNVDDWGTIQFYKKNNNRFVTDGATIPFLKKESLLGAVFADTREIYECNIKKAFDRLSMMGRLYYERTQSISADANVNCQSYYLGPISYFNWMATTLKHDNSDNVESAYNQAYNLGRNAIKDINDNLQLESCPLIY